MWKREEPVSPPQPASPPAKAAVPVPPTPAANHPVRQELSTVNIGKSVVIKGELSGSEDLTIEGQVEGKIELRQNLLTIGPNAKIKAQVFAKTVVVEGHVQGNISAGERIDIRDKGIVEGNLAAPRVAIADGAQFRGSVDMQGAGKFADTASESKPTPAPAPTPTVVHPSSAPTAVAR
jgi:cytoskeletal protein CcmA (bactofilin family)